MQVDSHSVMSLDCSDMHSNPEKCPGLHLESSYKEKIFWGKRVKERKIS